MVNKFPSRFDKMAVDLDGSISQSLFPPMNFQATFHHGTL